MLLAGGSEELADDQFAASSGLLPKGACVIPLSWKEHKSSGQAGFILFFAFFSILHLSKWMFLVNFATTEETFHLVWSLEAWGRDFWQNTSGLCFSDPSALVRHCNVKREVKERKA